MSIRAIGTAPLMKEFGAPIERIASFQESIGWEHFETDWYWSSSDNYPWGGSAVVENSGNVEGPIGLRKRSTILYEQLKTSE